MESQGLEAVTSELQRHRNLVHQKATAVRSDLWTVEKDLARIDAALAALSGNATNTPSNGSNAKESRRTSRGPSAKKADVIATMRRVLEEEQVMVADALRHQVESLLTERGFNRFGFAMRWKEACQDSQFIATQTGIRLAERDTTESTEMTHDHMRGSSVTNAASSKH